MCANNFMNHGGCGCSSSCNNECSALGPFVAIDAACILPPQATGSIIPFSSGITTVILASLATGLITAPSLIGFGTAIPGPTILGNTIDLSGVVTEAFSVPRPGNITAISASFTATLGVTLVGTTTVTATVYRAPAGSTLFTATSATVNLAPAFTGIIAVGQTAFASATVPPVPVVTGDRLLMVFSITTAGVTVIQTLTGTASAGITIE
ncbi:exosporium glycoprotein BclB-related protein [Lysinibacillus parviboronicapiens]|uniref:exosporium glycoprotein BclB-related protein n=1 Tax=Lysinibacillus parviboronicapiens TaxID=436516 RepID=UPI0006D28B57|nr:exosporium glycoprotein BclB-related protein [Lysinibacillus parviboronicapiens]